MQEIFKQIPQVSKLLLDKEITEKANNLYVSELKQIIEDKLNEIRSQIVGEKITKVTYDEIKNEIIKKIVDKSTYSLQKVINGTGTVVHTNLGRSVIQTKALENIVEVASSYNNLEYDLKTGKRGSRYEHLDKIAANVFGSEAALVVNNNAAATMLAVGAFAKNKEVVVSRGELVEIGGSFRIPDIIEASNAILKEVGTTNRTHLRDYENAICDETAMLVKVHPSNYKMEGFTKEVTNKEVVELAKKANANRENKIITLEDLGSGSAIDFKKYTNLNEVTIKESLNSGIDLVTFSGDKLLGGVQAGIILGNSKLIEVIKKHPLTRAFRVCKLTISALEVILRSYYDERSALKEIPTLRMLTQSLEELENKTSDLIEVIIKNETECDVKMIELDSIVGGGSSPTDKLKSYGLAITCPNLTANDVEKKMRNYNTPIIGRIIDDKYCLDIRTIFKKDYSIIVDAISQLCS